MCGIAGSVNTEINDQTLDLIRHRGPDANGFVQENINENRISKNSIACLQQRFFYTKY